MLDLPRGRGMNIRKPTGFGWEVISDLCQSNFKECGGRKLTVPDRSVGG